MGPEGFNCTSGPGWVAILFLSLHPFEGERLYTRTGLQTQTLISQAQSAGPTHWPAVPQGIRVEEAPRQTNRAVIHVVSWCASGGRLRLLGPSLHKGKGLGGFLETETRGPSEPCGAAHEPVVYIPYSIALLYKICVWDVGGQ
jgi:hypothetical protein